MDVGLKTHLKESTPDIVYPLAILMYTLLHPHRNASYIRRDGDLTKAKNLRSADVLYYPTLKHGGRIASAQKNKYSIYTLSGFVEPARGDTIVEVGAFVGEFTTSVAGIAGDVLAIEPDPVSSECLRHNTRKFDNVSIEELVVSNLSREVEFELGDDPTENSLFGVDIGTKRDVIKTRTSTLQDVCKVYGIDTIDYLKIDAEGAEPEVLKGIGGLTVRKIAVQVGPERDGDWTTDEVQNMLNRRGYKTKLKNKVLFGRIDG